MEKLTVEPTAVGNILEVKPADGILDNSNM